MPSDSLRRRVAALSEIVRPRASLAAKVAALDDHERAEYDQWRQEMDRWHERFPTQEGAYQAAMNGDWMPRLPLHVADNLFGRTTHIPETATVDEARQLYDNVRIA
ncbi:MULTISPECIES: hypothetical protein [Sphingobium]|uniref:hypothetical protein n=1 Tax=Sphingobium TaxID=165695 RepID=UPI00159C6F5A|nr:hypothetical protein [Sphingobium sp. 15-1]